MDSKTAPSNPRPPRGGLWIPGWEPAPGRLARARMDDAQAMHALEEFDHASLLPGTTVLQCISAAAQRDPAKAAMVYLSSADLHDAQRVVRYDQLLDAVRRAAAVFAEAADAQRSVVGVILPMLPETLIAVWGAQTAGIAVDPGGDHHPARHAGDGGGEDFQTGAARGCHHTRCAGYCHAGARGDATIPVQGR